MHELLADIPFNRRSFVKTMLFDAVRNAPMDRDTSEVIREAFADWTRRATTLPPML